MSALDTPEVSEKILIIEDETALAEGLAYNLRREGYQVSLAPDGRAGLALARSSVPDFILLDIMLPGMQGTEVLRELRSQDRTREVPVIILSAKSEEADQVKGFTLGADDYVTKPFSVKVLQQRIKALKRRKENPEAPSDILSYGDVRIDQVRHRAFRAGNEMELTPTEYRLLECLLRQPGRAFSRQQLMAACIGEVAVVLDRTIDVHIKTLRKKLGDPELVETVRGVGYRFKE
ncbi:MAG: DNA-binding response regulator [Planctomycetota bacterium]|nr:MAG: DNA-binding response regulator [Planctomycetota bacterium]